MKFLIAIFLLSPSLWAHEGHHHHDPTVPAATKTPEESQKLAFLEINRRYEAEVKPIFEKSCYDCHSQKPRLPWYHGLPLAHSLIEGDMSEAKEHLDLTNGFPFAGHGTPIEDLNAISEVTEKGTMPPTRYLLLHWRAGVSENEKKSVLDWVNDSKMRLHQP